MIELEAWQKVMVLLMVLSFLLIFLVWAYRRVRLQFSSSNKAVENPKAYLDCSCFHFADLQVCADYYRLLPSARSPLQNLSLALGVLYTETALVHLVIPFPSHVLVSTDFAPWLDKQLRQCPRPLLNRLVIEVSGWDQTTQIVVRRLRNMGCRVVRLLDVNSRVDLVQCHDWDGFTLHQDCVLNIDKQVAQQLRFRALYRAHLANLHSLIFVLGVKESNQWSWLLSQGKIGAEGRFFSNNRHRFWIDKHTLTALFTR